MLCAIQHMNLIATNQSYNMIYLNKLFDRLHFDLYSIEKKNTDFNSGGTNYGRDYSNVI